MDGRSFLPLLRGAAQAGRTRVFTQFHQTAARRRYPMRCVQNARWGYIFNPWSDGRRVFRNESQSGRTMKAMQAAAEGDPAIAARVKHFLYRTVEEFYDLQNDPDALENLIGRRDLAAEIDSLRGELAAWMARTGDPALAALRGRDSPEVLAKFMAEQDAAAKARAGGRRRRRGAAARRQDG
jgi:N-sulfoglucosamine sulfohydrolase